MRIYIIGSVGSGKTTLARQLASQLDIPHYETDNFVWQRQKGGDIRNAEAVRDEQLVLAAKKSNWIIEGVHIGWTNKVLQKADLIVFLDIPYHTRSWRFVLRYVKQKMGKEPSNYSPSLAMLRKMFGWNRYFEKTIKKELLQQLQTMPEKTLVLVHKEEINELKAILAKRGD